MTPMIWRIILAVVAAVIVFAVVPPLARILGFPISADVWLVLRICVAGLAVLYILRGRGPGA